jgi:Fe-S-cluster-containing dehydrogenase component
MRTRPRDGIVYLDQSLCVGCKSCIIACPWGAPQWHPELGRVVKCDYCMDRLDQGLQPACVAKCVTHCLEFGKIADMERGRRDQIAKMVAFELETVVSAR